MYANIGVFYRIEHPDKNLWIYIGADEADFLQIATGELAVVKLAAIELATQE